MSLRQLRDTLYFLKTFIPLVPRYPACIHELGLSCESPAQQPEFYTDIIKINAWIIGIFNVLIDSCGSYR